MQAIKSDGVMAAVARIVGEGERFRLEKREDNTLRVHRIERGKGDFVDLRHVIALPIPVTGAGDMRPGCLLITKDEARNLANEIAHLLPPEVSGRSSGDEDGEGD